jgi:bacterial/archaeal transporter family-2 protein
MYYFISALIGMMISAMIAANGQLAVYWGDYPASVIIHLVGLVFTIIVLAVKKEWLRIKKGIPFWLYIGGAIGVGTVVFNNFAYGKISVLAITALSLLGQCLSSVVIDQFGLLNMPRRPFQTSKIGGLVIILGAIGILLYAGDISSWSAVLVSLLSGITVTVSRVINAGLGEKYTVLQSTFFNFLTGLTLSIAILLISGASWEPYVTGDISKAWIYFGGILGVFVVTLSNQIVVKISAFYMTLLSFLGQLSMSVLLDIFLGEDFSFISVVGGTLVFFGLVQNLYVEKRDV